jgi:hypothetical protein
MLAIQRKGLLAIRSLRDHLHLGNRGEQRDEALTDDVVIVNHEQADGFAG